jgi:hypothetical protein
VVCFFTRYATNFQRLVSKGVDYVPHHEQWLDSTGPFKDVMISMFATLAEQGMPESEREKLQRAPNIRWAQSMQS